MVTDLFSIFYAVLLLMGSFAECHIKVGSTCTLRGPSFLYLSREGFMVVLSQTSIIYSLFLICSSDEDVLYSEK